MDETDLFYNLTPDKLSPVVKFRELKRTKHVSRSVSSAMPIAPIKSNHFSLGTQIDHSALKMQ